MATIYECPRLLKRVVLSNLSSAKGLSITPMLSGPHGIGKSMIIKSTAEQLGGHAFIIEGGSLKEGEITGLPFMATSTTGEKEVRFVKYYVINKIYELEKYYYNKAITTGFLDGKVKLEVAENGNHYLIYNKERVLVSTPIDLIERGEENKWKFGDELPANIKEELIQSGEFRLILLFIDELNRAEQQTMKELMNIILNRSVNGYDLPWWCNVISAVNPSSQNSTYATNEMDDAQKDRFLKIKVSAKVEEWINYALERNLNSDVVEAIAISDGIFMRKDSTQQDQDEMSPSPRSWEMVCHLYDTARRVNASQFFNAEERKELTTDLRTLIRGKVGDDAARVMLEALNNRADHIKPEEIFTGKSQNISPEIVDKFKRLRQISKTIIVTNCVKWLDANINKFKEAEKSGKPEGKQKWMNIMSQIGQFASEDLLGGATQLLFVKTVIKTGTLYSKISKAFASDVLTVFMKFRSDLDNLNKQ